MKIEIRSARKDEADVLSEVALRSKAHWGYSREMLEGWRPELTMTREYIIAHAVRSICLEGRVVGFYAFKATDDNYLDHFWLLPEIIGKGIGRFAFQHATQLARELGMSSSFIISDANAEGFYLKMKAQRVGLQQGHAQNRTLPKLLFRVADLAVANQ